MTAATENVQFRGEKISGLVDFQGMQLRAQDPEQMQTLMQELERRKNTKRDYIVPAKAIDVVPDTELDVVEGGEIERRHIMSLAFGVPGHMSVPVKFPMNAHALTQLSARYPIGTRYPRELLALQDDDAARLLARNMNFWLQRDSRSLLIRTLDDIVRACLSDRYRVLDNYDLAYATAGPIQEAGAAITQLSLTDQKFRIRALIQDWKTRIERQDEDIQHRQEVYQAWHADLSDGGTAYFDRQAPQALGTSDEDWIIPGISVSNSETGQGGLQVQVFALREICMNGTVMDASFSRIHLGERQELQGLISAATMQKKDEVFWDELRDIVRATFDAEKFTEMVKRMSAAAQDLIPEPVKAVDSVVSEFKMTPEERQGVLNNLFAQQDPTRWGLINAVTALAHRTEDPDEQHRYAEIGGRMLEMVRVR